MRNQASLCVLAHLGTACSSPKHVEWTGAKCKGYRWQSPRSLWLGWRFRVVCAKIVKCFRFNRFDITQFTGSADWTNSLFIQTSNPPANLSCYLQEMVNTIHPVAQKRRSGKMSLLLSEEVSKTTSDVDHTCLWHDNTRHLIHHPSWVSLQKTLGFTHWSDMSSIPEWASNMRSSGIKPGKPWIYAIYIYVCLCANQYIPNAIEYLQLVKGNRHDGSPAHTFTSIAPKFMESHFQRHSNAHAMMPSKSLLKFNLKNSQNKEKPLIFQIASSPFSISSRCLFPGKASSSIIWAMHPAKLWKVANSFICRYLHPLTTRSPCFDSTLLQILSQPQKTRKRQGWTRHKTCT